MSGRNALMVASLVVSIAIGLALQRGRGDHEGASRSAERPRIGLSLDTLKEARWQADRDMFVARATELGAEVLVQSANGDDARQIGDVDSLLSRGVRVLVIVAHDGTAMAKAVRLAHDAGVPVIAYDRMIRDVDVDLYISFDNVRVGEMQARFLVDHLPTPGKGRIVRVLGSKSDDNAFQFKAGQDAVLGPLVARGDIQIVHEDWADDWKPENAKKIVSAALSKGGPGFDAVLASNDGTAGGAVQALLEEGLAGKVLVTGQDAEPIACQRILAGTQAMTVYKPLRLLATQAAEAAVAFARGRAVVARSTRPNGKIDVPAILADVVAVTRDNLYDTVVKDGFVKREALEH